MSRYRISVRAREDLKEIYRYIAKDNPTAAGQLRDAFYEKFRMLVRQPLIGEACQDLLPDLRFFTVGNYVIFYVLADNGVKIIRVLHGARDVDALFGHS